MAATGVIVLTRGIYAPCGIVLTMTIPIFLATPAQEGLEHRIDIDKPILVAHILWRQIISKKLLKDLM